MNSLRAGQVACDADKVVFEGKNPLGVVGQDVALRLLPIVDHFYDIGGSPAALAIGSNARHHGVTLLREGRQNFGRRLS